MKLDSNLVVFITGGASGLGEASVKYFLTHGCKVAIADIDTEKMEKFANNLGSLANNEKFAYFKCDVTKEDQVKEVIEKTVAKFGQLHVALCSAGINLITPMLTSKTVLNTKAFKKIIDINLMGSVYVAKYATIAMSKNKPTQSGERGVLLFVSSIVGNEAPRGQVAYSASKAAI